MSRVEPTQLDQLLHPSFDPAARRRVIATGRPASPGAVTGKVVFTAEEAEKRAAAGDAVILVRNETSPEDIGGMNAAQGILTATGGMTSHAAVVARGMGKCCVAGAGTVRIDYDAERFTAGDVVVKAGDVISLDGTAGEVLLGAVPTKPAVVTKEFDTLLGWADGFRRLGVRTNADTPRDAEVAYRYGAEGIGLCRTEHMFFDGDRITAVREMILAEAKEARDAALAKLLPMQRQDFVGIFKEMKGKPVTIRLLDPPLHEFLPHEPEQVRTVAESLKLPEGVVRDRARRLHEMNPMLGHRGCRLGITFPEIYEMQVRAIYEAAAAEVKAKRPVRPEVMIPLVGTRKELAILRERLTKVADDVLGKAKVKLPVVFGTMIEVPRAALQAEHVAHEAEFFSFGTNDLTQMTFGYSRDDAGSFLPAYVEQGILPEDPFQSLDQEGVGELIRMAVERGRRTRPGLKVGICGEHGGDPDSVKFCHRVGLTTSRARRTACPWRGSRRRTRRSPSARPRRPARRRLPRRRSRKAEGLEGEGGREAEALEGEGRVEAGREGAPLGPKVPVASPARPTRGGRTEGRPGGGLDPEPFSPAARSRRAQGGSTGLGVPVTDARAGAPSAPVPGPFVGAGRSWARSLRGRGPRRRARAPSRAGRHRASPARPTPRAPPAATRRRRRGAA